MEYSELKKRHFGNNDTNKKLTDEEIISSLEVIATTRNCNECKIRNCKWGTCNCSQITANVALDLINRQNAEIERLKECPKCVYEYDGEVIEYCVQGPCPNFKSVEQIKTEAYKEFAERLKNKIKTECNPYGKPTYDYDTSISIMNYMDNLVKEMIGEKE